MTPVELKESYKAFQSAAATFEADQVQKVLVDFFQNYSS